MMEELKIDPGLRDLIPQQSKEEQELLHQSLDTEGKARDRLIAWRQPVGLDILVDGHNRYHYCREHGLAYRVDHREFNSREAVEEFIVRQQLGRRNVSPMQASLLRGRLYNSAKGKVGSNQHTGSLGQSDQGSTACKIAKQTGVSEKTVRRDGEFADAVKALEIEKEVMSGEEGRSRRQIIAAAATQDGELVRGTRKSASAVDVVVNGFQKLDALQRREAHERITAIWKEELPRDLAAEDQTSEKTEMGR